MRDNRSATQRYHDDRPIRPYYSAFTASQSAARKEIDKQMNDYPEDWAEGMEHYLQFHHCIWCGHNDHESNLIQDGPGWWIHSGCSKQFNDKQEYLTKKQYESKINESQRQRNLDGK
jgi:hypothetical protein